jgi:hypothetical protein
VALVLERTIPTERPPLVVEVSANLLRIEDVAWSAQRISTAYSRISRTKILTKRSLKVLFIKLRPIVSQHECRDDVRGGICLWFATDQTPEARTMNRFRPSNTNSQRRNQPIQLPLQCSHQCTPQLTHRLTHRAACVDTGPTTFLSDSSNLY